MRISRILTSVSVAGAFALLATAPRTATAQAAEYASGANGSMCMDLANTSLAEGSAVVLRHCNGGTSQQFVVQSDGHVMVMNGNRNARGQQMCVDYHPNAGNNGDPVTIWPCRNLWGTRDNQHWSRSNNQFVAGSGRCIDINGGANNASRDGTPLVLWDCPDPGHFGTRTWNQRATAVAAAPAAPAAPAQPAVHPEALALDDGSGALCLARSGSEFRTAYCDESHNMFVKTWYRSRNAIVVNVGNECLTAVRRGQPVVLRRCDGSKAQDWYFDGTGQIQNQMDTNGCVDIEGGLGVNRRALLWDCDYTQPERNRKLNQRFFDGAVKPRGLAQGGAININVADALTQGLLKVNAAGVIAAGGGNVIAAGGGNVIAPGGGNVIAAGGGNVIAPNP